MRLTTHVPRQSTPSASMRNRACRRLAGPRPIWRRWPASTPAWGVTTNMCATAPCPFSRRWTCTTARSSPTSSRAIAVVSSSPCSNACMSTIRARRSSASYWTTTAPTPPRRRWPTWQAARGASSTSIPPSTAPGSISWSRPSRRWPERSCATSGSLHLTNSSIVFSKASTRGTSSPFDSNGNPSTFKLHNITVLMKRNTSVPTRAADMENRTGQKSAARIGIEEAGDPSPAAARRAHTHGTPPRRCGRFAPAPSAVVAVERKPEPLRADLPGWDDYIAAATDHRAHLARKQREEKERYESEMAQFRAQKAERSAAIAAQQWKGKGELLNAMRSVTAAEAKKVELEIRERHRREAKALRDARDAWPEYHDWLAKWFSREAAGDYRYHRHEPLRLEGDGDNEALPRDLRAFNGEILGGAVEYRRQGAAGGVSEEVSITDHGRRIDVHEAHDDAATLAALQLGAAKWGKVSVYGSDAYKATCVRLAAEHGIRIANPELQEQVEAAKEARRVAREEAMRAPQM